MRKLEKKSGYRKLAVLLLILALIGATACSAPPADDPGSQQSTAGTSSKVDTVSGDDLKKYDLTTDEITLKMWESDEGGKKELLEYAAAEFTKLYPNITFTYENVNHSDAATKLALDGPAGVGPDVFCSASDHLGNLVGSSLVLENQYAVNFKENYYSAALNASSLDGIQYGYPLSLETYALFYNKDVIDAPPKTWDEVIKLAKEFNDPANNKYAIVWETRDTYYGYMFTAKEGNFLFGPNGDDPAQHNLNSQASIEGMTYFQSLRKQILDVPSGDMTWEFCMSEFAESKAAMYITGAWSVSAFEDAGINYGVATLPSLPGESNPATSFSGARVMFVSSYSKHPNEAQAFLDFLCSKEMLQKRYEDAGELPPRTDIEVVNENDLAFRNQLQFSFAMPSIPEMGTYWTAMGSAVSNIWDGADIKSELDMAAQAIEASTN